MRTHMRIQQRQSQRIPRGNQDHSWIKSAGPLGDTMRAMRRKVIAACTSCKASLNTWRHSRDKAEVPAWSGAKSFSLLKN